MAETFDVNDVAIRDGLAQIAVEHKNDGLIWREVAPVIKVSQRSGSYRVYDESTNFDQTPDTLNSLAKANEIEIKHSDQNYSVQSRGLAAIVPEETIVEAQASGEDIIDPLGKAIIQVRTQLENRHEKRVADVVFAAANYGSSYKATLSGTSQWSHASAKPISAILTAMDVPLTRPNTLVLGSDTWRGMRTNPEVVAAIYPAGGNAANGGMVTSAALLAALRDEGLERVLIGRARVNTAKPGATPVYARAWGKLALLAYVNSNPAKDDFTFAATFSEMLTNPTIVFDEQMGEKGAYRVQDAWNEDVEMIASAAGYLWVDAVA